MSNIVNVSCLSVLAQQLASTTSKPSPSHLSPTLRDFFELTQPRLLSYLQAVVDSATSAVNYVSESAQQLASGASKETNKEVAKDSNASIGTRLSAGVDALGDKVRTF